MSHSCRAIHTAALILSLALPILLCNSGCSVAGAQTSALAAADAIDSAIVEAALFAVQFDGLAAALTPEQAAAQAQAQMQPYLDAAGCGTSERNGHVVSYRLDRCTLPYGVPQLSGELTIAFAILDGLLQACLAGARLDAGGIPTALLAWGTVDGAPTSRLNCASGGQGAHNTQFERRGRHAIAWSDGCLRLDGAWETTSADRTFTTTLDGYHQCPASCPQPTTVRLAGGDLSGLVTLRYDGSAACSWSAGRERGSIALGCGVATLGQP